MEFTNKEQVFYNKYIGNFATPKKLNRSTTFLPDNIINIIEEGKITSTLINQTASIVPVYTYKTCLTIHGNLPAIERNRIGSYKNLIQNKNGSLEIRYSAIDYEAKKQISKYIGYGNAWSCKENSSTGIFFEKVKIADDRATALNILAELKTEVENFNIDGMKAKVYCAGYNIWGRYYLVLSVHPLTIHGNPLSIAATLTEQTEDAILTRIEAERKEAAIQDEKRQQERNAREANKATAASKLSSLKKEPIQPIEGKIYISPVIFTNGLPGYRFYKVVKKGTFGRFILTSYLDKEPTFNAEKLAEFRKGKQLKASEIINETYLIPA
jgi:hypothetical protein